MAYEEVVDEFTNVEEIGAVLDEALENAEEITETLLSIIAEQQLLAWFDPTEAVLVAKELWDGVRSVAAGVISADLAAQGIPFDLTFQGQEL